MFSFRSGLPFPHVNLYCSCRGASAILFGTNGDGVCVTQSAYGLAIGYLPTFVRSGADG